MEVHFRDGTGTEYNPYIVRIGVGASKDIESVTLNTISQSVSMLFIYWFSIKLMKKNSLNLFLTDKARFNVMKREYTT